MTLARHKLRIIAVSLVLFLEPIFSAALSWAMAASFFFPPSFFSFAILCTVGRTPWTEFRPVARHLPITWTTQNKQTFWSESSSELYRPSDRRLSAILVPTFGDRGFYMVSVTSLRPYSRLSRPESLLFFHVAPQLYSQG
jgi:hypothetical protein